MTQYGEPLPQALLGAAFSTALYPLQFAKVLMQVGYEPCEPIPCRTIFGSNALAYPNMFKYLGAIRQKSGYFSVYHGFSAKLLSSFINSVASSKSSELISRTCPFFHNSVDGEDKKDDNDDKKKTVEHFKQLFYENINETASRCVGIVVSYPCQVVMVRCIVSYIGKEVAYKSFLSSVREIYHEEGISGFFAGLIPRLLGEIITIWLTNTLTHLVHNYLVPIEHRTKETKQYTCVMSGLMVSQFTYPFGLVSNLMSINNTRLAAGHLPFAPIYRNWIECWCRLSTEGNLKRGSSMFWRYYKGTALSHYSL